MRNDPSMFEEYHSGFRSQSSGWPSSPVQIFIDTICSTFSASHQKPLIADLGCGDAQLARVLVPKGYPVFSYDLVSQNSFVVEAQCTERLPLPGGEQSEGAVIDIVVCCLSLMGNDWLKMIQESKRVMKVGGKLKIAEVSSRFPDINAFVELVKEVGFKLNTKVRHTAKVQLCTDTADNTKSLQSGCLEYAFCTLRVYQVGRCEAFEQAGGGASCEI